MNRFVVVAFIVVFCLLFIVDLFFADRFQAEQKSRGTLMKIEPQHKTLDKAKVKRTMPSFTPDPNIDYKIQRMVVDDSIDYKILNAGPHKPIPDDLKPKRRIIRPFNFRYPNSTLNLKNGTTDKAAESLPGVKKRYPLYTPQRIPKQND